jgi:hypothetical protein
MPADQAGTGPGPQSEEPSESIREEIRPDLSVADLVKQDLNDPATPSSLTADGTPTQDSFAVDLE